MNPFEIYLQLGIEHILDIQARDHILFILVMIVIYRPTEWKAVIWIVTSFTIGHSLTLALAALGFISIPTVWIEVIIALTIFSTALENIFMPASIRHRVWLSGVFGLIHGLGFSNFLKAMLGQSHDIILQLFAFNIGVEVGQIVILMILFVGIWGLTTAFKLKTRDIVVVLSVLVAVQSFLWILNRVGWLELPESIAWLI